MATYVTEKQANKLVRARFPKIVFTKFLSFTQRADVSCKDHGYLKHTSPALVVNAARNPCTKCQDNYVNPLMYSYEDMVKKLQVKFKHLDFVDFTKPEDTCTLICTKHNNIIDITKSPRHWIKRKHNPCLECNPEYISYNRVDKSSANEFVRMLHKNLYVKNYKGWTIGFDLHCKIHGLLKSDTIGIRVKGIPCNCGTIKHGRYRNIIESKRFILSLLEHKKGSVQLVGKYLGSFIPTEFQCSNGHTWQSTPAHVAQSARGCVECSRKYQGIASKTTSQWKKECYEISNKGLEPVTMYKGIDTKIDHRCKCGNIEKISPANIIGFKFNSCSDCRKTNSSNYSVSAIDWLTRMSYENDIFIQHARNFGEKTITIGSKHIRVDGYCEKTNSIYEYLGDDWHGSPYTKKKHPNPHSDLTSIQLFQSSMLRFGKLVKRGFNVYWVWESDYKDGLLVSGCMLSKTKR